ncbi:ras association domain-containing protein 6 isoform X4 [Salvelinus fontinalis]|uniref:ras association domain-containing protein 6 isoform X4 n=1 Tax=Salvelinus fontinalis TaxID=8038 RepID=UPI0024869CEE|nr:ras association domain-containing protein 6 isoform X4 [Salvelinus fontinalis]
MSERESKEASSGVTIGFDSTMMNTHVVMRDGRVLSRAEFLSLLNTYNCFLKDKTQQHLVFCERDDGDVVFEGVLNISWGVRQPIRLKIQDDKQQPFTSLLSPDPVSPISPHGGKRGMTRWGEFEDLHQINETEETNKQDPVEETNNRTTGSYRSYDSCTLRPTPTKQKTEVEEEQSNLIRCVSDASLVKRRVKRSPQRERNRLHCFSINGHFYNYKIENDPNEFALYCVHQSGEKKKLSDSDLPLWERLVQGPAEDIMKMFLMDRDEEEVSNDVAQYLNLELPILEGVLVKLEEEENRAVERITSKYNQQQIVLSQLLSSKITKTETERT